MALLYKLLGASQDAPGVCLFAHPASPLHGVGNFDGMPNMALLYTQAIVKSPYHDIPSRQDHNDVRERASRLVVQASHEGDGVDFLDTALLVTRPDLRSHNPMGPPHALPATSQTLVHWVRMADAPPVHKMQQESFAELAKKVLPISWSANKCFASQILPNCRKGLKSHMKV
ncbi:hypothetical protein C8R44DRAFT_754648 [Mycena epipterygia]|nr:hypothetical protein C8R44DRAFT_754648 [Mycena epipterygia]